METKYILNIAFFSFYDCSNSIGGHLLKYCTFWDTYIVIFTSLHLFDHFRLLLKLIFMLLYFYLTKNLNKWLLFVYLLYFYEYFYTDILDLHTEVQKYKLKVTSFSLYDRYNLEFTCIALVSISIQQSFYVIWKRFVKTINTYKSQKELYKHLSDSSLWICVAALPWLSTSWIDDSSVH